MSLTSVTPKKSLGQNFLLDKNISNKIVGLLGNIENKDILEIGPGMGALTDILLAKQAKVLAIDKDSNAVEYLTEKYKDKENLKILNSDIRTIDLSKLYNNKISVIGNIPYNISTDILFWLLEHSNYIDQAVLTVQREVAERLCAKHKTKSYGITTVAVQLYGTAKIIFHIPPKAFFPAPKVTSSVLKIEFNDHINNSENKQIMSLVRTAFSQRRKMINNSIKQYLSNNNIESDLLAQYLEKENLKYLTQRAEELTVEDFVKFYKIISNIK